MSDSPKNETEPDNQLTEIIHASSAFQEQSQLNRNNVIAISRKQFNDVIQFQEPSSSTNYSFKTEIRINILGEPKSSQKSIDTNDSTPLSLFNENEIQEKKESMEMELEESFTTIDTCIKEKTTSTNEPTMFSRNDRTQRTILVNSEAPPPYDSRPPPAYSTTPYASNQPQYQEPLTASRQSNYYSYDSEYFEFITLEMRHFFIKKVFFILSIQLMITTGLIMLVMFHMPTRKFVATNKPMFWIMSGTEMVLYMTLMCYQAPRRLFPLNLILLTIFTIALSYICAAITIMFSTKVIVTTIGSTALICLVVALLACQTKFDITKWSFIIGIASIIMMIFSFVVIIISLIYYSVILWLIYSALVTVLFSVFLLYDMQCIFGGRRHELSPEEYIYATLTLYVDIIMIFLYMLQLVNACSS